MARGEMSKNFSSVRRRTLSISKRAKRVEQKIYGVKS